MPKGSITPPCRIPISICWPPPLPLAQLLPQYLLPGSLSGAPHVHDRLYAGCGQCKSIFAPELHEGTAKMYGDGSAIMLCEMDNGSLLRVTGCSSFGGHGNWYRLACTKATAEMVRGQENKVLLRYNEWDKPEGAEAVSIYASQWPEYGDLAEKAGHGGGDFWEMYHFVRYIAEGIEPFFNVYRSTAISAVGILGWRSALNGGKEYKIPDFAKEKIVYFMKMIVCPPSRTNMAKPLCPVPAVRMNLRKRIFKMQSPGGKRWA